MIKAAIIDDGVNKIIDNTWVITTDDVIERILGIEPNTARKSHADYCMDIIDHYLPEEKKHRVLWHNIKILDRSSLTANIDALIYSLEFCLDMNIKVIHLSIGSSCYHDFDRIEKVVNKLSAQNTIIIASTNNNGTITFPACLPNVFGVKTDSQYCDNQFVAYETSIDGIELVASSKHNTGSITSGNSNSFASPLITSLVLEYLIDHDNANYMEIKSFLGLNSFHLADGHTKALYSLPSICPGSKYESIGPIVVFSGFTKKELFVILNEFFKQFCLDGYHARVIADAFDYHALGFSHIPIIDEIDRYLEYMAFYFQCDILLAGITNREYAPKNTLHNYIKGKAYHPT